MWMAAADVMVTDLGDELILMDAAQGEMFSLNETGRRLWQTLPAEDSDLTALLVQTYNLTQAQAQADVTEWLGQLRQRQLVKPA